MINDYRAIENLLYRYAECIDDGDLEAVAQLFSNGSINAEAMPEPATGATEVLAMYRASTRLYADNGTPHTQHIVSNPIIEIETGGQFATSRSRFTVMQATPELALQAIITGRYHDRLQKIESQWYFAERKMKPELLGNLSQHLLFPDSDLNL
jgi:3-phenylpropionate/cinnamic acid dioxygenase small subunit